MREESAWLEDSVRVCDQEADRQKEKDTDTERERGKEGGWYFIIVPVDVREILNLKNEKGMEPEYLSTSIIWSNLK